MVAPVSSLTEEQIGFFHEQGYLQVDAITTDDEVEQVREIYDRLFAEGSEHDLWGSKGGKDAKLPQTLYPSEYEPELKTSLIYKNAEAIAQDLLGPDTHLRGEHAIFKKPGSPSTPWHQDEAYWDPALHYESLSIWIPLQEANEDNGCMYFIPGTHRDGVQPHHHISNDPNVRGLEIDEADDSQAVACPLPPGGATMHHSQTFHFTPPNRSDIPRRALSLIFGREPKTLSTPRTFPWQQG